MAIWQTQLEAIVTARELLNKWTGCTENDLAKLISENRIQAYWYNKTLSAPDGKVIYLCDKGNIHPEPSPYDDGTYDWGELDFETTGGIVFDPDEVATIENNNQHFLWEVKTPREPSPVEQRAAYLETELERLKAENEVLKADLDEDNNSSCSNCISLTAKLKEQKELTSRKRWKPSFEAVCEVYQVIFQQGDKVWNKDFIALLAQHYKGPESILEEAEKIAWKYLPATLKSSRGEKRPK